MKASLDDLTPAQRRRLLQFKAEAGRGWKAQLLGFWILEVEDVLPGGDLLRQIREQFGPTWLRWLP